MLTREDYPNSTEIIIPFDYAICPWCNKHSNCNLHKRLLKIGQAIQNCKGFVLSENKQICPIKKYIIDKGNYLLYCTIQCDGIIKKTKQKKVSDFC